MNTISETVLRNNPETLSRLDGVVIFLEWLGQMPLGDRTHLLNRVVEDGDEVQKVVASRLSVLRDARATESEKAQALSHVTDVLFTATSPVSQQHQFALRLRELMSAKQVSQLELAERVGCSQPAISQMMNRACRPQRKTILKLAEALHVQPRDLWPDLDVADMLDATVSFQADDYEMTTAEAAAFAKTATKNKPKVRAKSLPSRP
jgi:transcriptional regulator with XRE-family HTH domain